MKQREIAPGEQGLEQISRPMRLVTILSIAVLVLTAGLVVLALRY